MRFVIAIFFLILLRPAATEAQQPDTKRVRVVDTLSERDQVSRNPILLRSELDSLVLLYAPVQPLKKPEEGLSKNENEPGYLWMGLAAIFLLTGGLFVLLFRYQRKITRALERQEKIDRKTNPRGKPSIQSLETKIGELDAELLKLSKENEGLNRVIKEYNGIQHEYDSLKHGFRKIFKVKNYPGNENGKDESTAIQSVLTTENAVAAYAYEKFLKPVLSIADANKNNPAKMSEADRVRLLDLLVSLSLLYIEYLYLRVADLSIGGTIVERIRGLSKGNGPDPALLKKLNKEFGSRALVLHMALGKASLHHLSYPVFDETNLNNP